ncbi:Sec-independent protein translocase protein TatB [Sulfuriferula thiophila]|uniref:Sec-independent protein translocase protein TatB n=1 Tax=Sulfuriferula thiophila TaxID=1781211 RepID=UPI000F60E033|nr:Sec-independent protein translocase protein TatB [Sulfuriferula thiophila]
MFDVGFSELMVIGVVALIVIGPERLPKVARTVGLLLGRVQRYVATVKSDISQEMQLDELRKSGQILKDSLQETGQQITDEVHNVKHTVESAVLPETDSIPETEITTAQTELPANEQEPAAIPDNLQGELAFEPMPITPPQPDTASIKPTTQHEHT